MYKLRIYIFMAVFSVVPNSFAAYSNLRILNIKPVGVEGMDANNRIFRAYPSLLYNIRAGVAGGMYPYIFEWVSSKPSWLSMDRNTGEISGIAPASPGTFNNITIRITDKEDTAITTSWSIEITTDRFIFLDAANGNPSAINGGTGTGTIDNPFKNVKDWYGGDEYDSKYRVTYPDYIVYYRAGTYYLDGYTNDAAHPTERRMYTTPQYKPVIHLAFPGESVKFNLESYKSWGSGGTNVYLDGLEFYNMLGYAIEVGSGYDYHTYRNLYMHNLTATSGHNNQSFFRVMHSIIGKYWVWQDCVFSDTPHSGILMYTLSQSLIEDCTFSNFYRDPAADADPHGIFPKTTIRDFTIRRNIFQVCRGDAIYAYLDQYTYGASGNIEICFNRTYDVDTSLALYAHANPDNIFIYRNTFSGNSDRLRNVTSGPVYINNNVIVNNNTDAGDVTSNLYYRSQLYFRNSPNAYGSDYLFPTDNLVGAQSDNIIDSSGNLTTAYSSYVGSRGWQLSSTSYYAYQIENFTRDPRSGNSQIFTWTNPTAADFGGLKIVRKIGSAPTSHNDGIEVYKDNGTTFTDTGLDHKNEYHYAFYTFNQSESEFSQPLALPSLNDSFPLP